MPLTKLQTGAITDKAVTLGKMSDGTDGQSPGGCEPGRDQAVQPPERPV